jgi:hypothetical protein
MPSQLVYIMQRHLHWTAFVLPDQDMYCLLLTLYCLVLTLLQTASGQLVRICTA